VYYQCVSIRASSMDAITRNTRKLLWVLFISTRGLLWTLLVSAGGLLLALYTFQDKLVYVPDVPPESRTELPDPRQFQMRNEDITLHTHDGEKIHCWLFKKDQDFTLNSPTIVFFHGNAGNIGHRLPNVKDFLTNVGCNVFMVEYRGYGKSTGQPTENGLKIDAVTAINYIRSRPDINPNKIVLFGRSLGGAVAVHVGKNNSEHIAAIILENTFTSVPDMMKLMFPMFSWFSFLCTNKWNSLESIKSFVKPTLFLSGDKDELVPRWMMEKLYKSCGSTKKKLKSFADGEHMDTWTQPEYWPTITDFLETIK